MRTCHVFKQALRHRLGIRVAYLHFRHTQAARPSQYGVKRMNTCSTQSSQHLSQVQAQNAYEGSYSGNNSSRIMELVPLEEARRGECDAAENYRTQACC